MPRLLAHLACLASVIIAGLASFPATAAPAGAAAGSPAPAASPAPAPAPQASPGAPAAAPATPAQAVTPGLAAQPGTNPPSAIPNPQSPAQPAADSLPDDGAQVAVLGYHELGAGASETAMRISTEKFRKQMQAIRDLGIPVIPMSDFEAWKRGEKNLPPKSIVITMDDGWKSVYTDAYPILKEFGFPFTLFLYKNYIDGGGKALTSDMIREMMQNGATLGSHSTSHPYPATIKKHRNEGPGPYTRFLNIELGDSKRFIEERFNVKVTTFAYPGGYHTDEMVPLADQLGYQFMFTVQPAKVHRNTPNALLPRYIILGNYDSIFDLALAFRDSPAAQAGSGTIAGLLQTTPVPVQPAAGAIVNTRMPVVSADLSSVENLDVASVKLAIAGFGQVPANFDPATGVISWQVNRRLRERFTQCVLTYKLNGATKPEAPIRWSFQIDRDSAYLPGADSAQ